MFLVCWKPSHLPRPSLNKQISLFCWFRNSPLCSELASTRKSGWQPAGSQGIILAGRQQTVRGLTVLSQRGRPVSWRAAGLQAVSDIRPLRLCGRRLLIDWAHYSRTSLHGVTRWVLLLTLAAGWRVSSSWRGHRGGWRTRSHYGCCWSLWRGCSWWGWSGWLAGRWPEGAASPRTLPGCWWLERGRGSCWEWRCRRSGLAPSSGRRRHCGGCPCDGEAAGTRTGSDGGAAGSGGQNCRVTLSWGGTWLSSAAADAAAAVSVYVDVSVCSRTRPPPRMTSALSWRRRECRCLWSWAESCWEREGPRSWVRVTGQGTRRGVRPGLLGPGCSWWGEWWTLRGTPARVGHRLHPPTSLRRASGGTRSGRCWPGCAGQVSGLGRTWSCMRRTDTESLQEPDRQPPLQHTPGRRYIKVLVHWAECELSNVFKMS